MIDSLTPSNLILAMILGFFLGSIPLAMLLSRIQGVDIFSIGPGLAGAANVYRNVGPISGALVLIGDIAKGVLAVTVAHRLGLEGELVLLPALAALLGHWRSVFTKFRGGDGLSTLLGITMAIIPLYGILAVMTGATVAFIAKGMGHHASLWGGTAGYGFLLVRSPEASVEISVVLGVVFLALLVLAHGVVGHRRRRIASP
jgi:glycerol-3-phosphate acyltransferase PlsY